MRPIWRRFTALMALSLLEVQGQESQVSPYARSLRRCK